MLKLFMSHLFVSTSGGPVYVLDVNSGLALTHLKDVEGGCVASVQGSVVCVASSQKAVMAFFKTQLEKPVSSFYKISAAEKISILKFSSCGNFCFTGYHSGTLTLHMNGNLVRQYPAHFACVTSLHLIENSLGEQLLVTAGQDALVKVFSLATLFSTLHPEPRLVFAGHATGIRAAELVTANKTLQVFSICSSKGKLWNLSTGQEIQSWNLDQPRCVAVGRNIYFVGLESGQISYFRQEEIKSLPAHGQAVTSLCLAEDHSMLVSCSSEGLKVWDTLSMLCVRVINPAAALDRHLPTQLTLINLTKKGISNPFTGNLKPLARVLTEVENLGCFHVQSNPLTRLDGIYHTSSWLESGKWEASIQDDEKPLRHTAEEIQKQREITLNYIHLLKGNSC